MIIKRETYFRRTVLKGTKIVICVCEEKNEILRRKEEVLWRIQSYNFSIRTSHKIEIQYVPFFALLI